jgi:hypothetical protein
MDPQLKEKINMSPEQAILNDEEESKGDKGKKMKLS